MNAIEKFAAMRAANKQAMTDMGKITEGIYSPVNTQTGNPQASQLPLTDRELVTEWMESNGFDDEDKTYILNDCKNPEARKYWVKRANGEIK